MKTKIKKLVMYGVCAVLYVVFAITGIACNRPKIEDAVREAMKNACMQGYQIGYQQATNRVFELLERDSSRINNPTFVYYGLAVFAVNDSINFHKRLDTAVVISRKK